MDTGNHMDKKSQVEQLKLKKNNLQANIYSFKNQIKIGEKEIVKINDILYNICDHDWVICDTGGPYSTRYSICKICDCERPF